MNNLEEKEYSTLEIIAIILSSPLIILVGFIFILTMDEDEELD